MALSLGVRGRDTVKDPRMQAARAKVFAACKANKIFFLNSFTPGDIVDMLKEGVMVGPANPEAAEIGRSARVVLPGVAAFGLGMDRAQRLGLRPALDRALGPV